MRFSKKLWQPIKKGLQWFRLRYLYHQDIARFSRTASLSALDGDFDKVTSRIVYNVHSLEKGLARNREPRLGFGRKALRELNDSLTVYRSRSYDTTSFAYIQGISIIRRYREHHERAGYCVEFLSDIVDDDFLRSSCEVVSAGTKVVKRSDKLRNSTKSFYELAQGRSSVREFSGEPIDHAKVTNVLSNAAKTPSVCNRQGWRVYWVDDKSLAQAVLQHQRGFGYPQLPEVLLAITVSNNTFLSPVERNQGFIDGGLFSMSVMYGLEHEGLAAVPLNACMYSRDQRAVRRLLDIDESEVIIMFIAVGAFMEESIVPVSDRKPVDAFVKRRSWSGNLPVADASTGLSPPATDSVASTGAVATVAQGRRNGGVRGSKSAVRTGA